MKHSSNFRVSVNSSVSKTNLAASCHVTTAIQKNEIFEL